MAEQKVAYRELYRNPDPPYQLLIRFIDAATGQVITNLTGYTVLDQGNDVDVPNVNKPNETPKPSTNTRGNSGGGGGGGRSGALDDFDKVKSHGSGDIIGDAVKTFGPMVEKVADGGVAGGLIDTILPGWRDAGKRAVADIIETVTGNPTLFKENDKTAMTPSPTTGGAPKPTLPQDSTKRISISGGIETRKMPVSQDYTDRLGAALSYASDLTGKDITVELTSMGQPPKGTEIDDFGRIGSTRHDVDPHTHEGNTSDMAIFVDGEPFDPKNDRSGITDALVKSLATTGMEGIGVGGGFIHAGGLGQEEFAGVWGYEGAGEGSGKAAYALPTWKEAYKQGIADYQAGKGDQIVRQYVTSDKSTATSQAIDETMPEGMDQRGDLAALDKQLTNMNKARELMGLTPVSKAAGALTGGVESAMGSLFGGIQEVGSGIGKAIAQNPWAFEDAGKAALEGRRSMTGDAIANEIQKRAPQAMAGMTGGIVDAANQGAQSLANMAGSAGKAVAGFMSNPALGTLVPNLSTPTGIAADAQVAKSIPLDERALDTITRTILGEAANQGAEGMAAVANVLKNRTIDGTWGDDPVGVALAPKQFSAWNPASNGGNDLVRTINPGNPLYEEAKQIAEAVFNGQIPDNTGGSLYYHTPAVQPGWANSVMDPKLGTAQIGDHIFYPQEEVKPFGGNVNTIKPTASGPTATTPTGASIPQTQMDAIRSTGNSSNNSTNRSGGGVMSNPTGKATTPTGSTVTQSQMDAIRSTGSSNNDSSGHGSNKGKSTPSTTKVTTSSGGTVTKSQADAIRSTSGVMSKPTPKPTTTSSSKPSPISKPTTSSPNKVTTSSGKSIYNNANGR